jgi:hypothetical protein
MGDGGRSYQGAMATAVELDDSHAGDHDRTRHELSPPLRVPGVAGDTVTWFELR